MAIKDWVTVYPTTIDTNTQQPTLVNLADKTRVSQIHTLRDVVQELEGEVGTTTPASGSLRWRVQELETSGSSLVVSQIEIISQEAQGSAIGTTTGIMSGGVELRGTVNQINVNRDSVTGSSIGLPATIEIENLTSKANTSNTIDLDTATNGIQASSDAEINLDATTNFDVDAGDIVSLDGGTINVTSTGSMTLSASSDVNASTGGKFNISASSGAELDTYLTLMDTTSSATGVVYKGSTRFLHNFHHATGDSAVPTGQNTFLGEGAGNFTLGSTATSVSQGSYNVGVGDFALDALTTGYANDGFGTSVLSAATTGYQNTAMGRLSLSNLIDGYNNVGVGQFSLSQITSGHTNIAIGRNSGRYIADGSTANQTSNTSVYLGNETKAQASGDSNEIVIGYNAVGEGSNTAKYGNADITGHYFSGSHYIMDTTSSTTGIIFKGTTRFLHNFHHADGGGAVPNGYNVFLGESAGNFTAGSTATNAIHASNNIGIGAFTLAAATTGYDNCAIGYASMNLLTTGYENAAIGIRSLNDLTTGYRNVGIGQRAGRYIADGSTSNETSLSSVYIGAYTKAKADGGNNEIVIGESAIGEGSNTAKYGNASITGHYFSGSHYIMDTTSSTTGIIFKGTTRFLHNFHHDTGSGAIPVGRNVFVGEDAGNFTMGSTATQTYHSTYNIGVGYIALNDVTTGYNLVAIGASALSKITTGNNCVALGESAMRDSTTAVYCMAIGTNALRNCDATGCTAVGVNGLFSITSGNYNTGIGYQAGRYIADGSTANQTSNTSTYLGTDTKAQASGDANEIVIGYNAIGEGSNTAKYGNASITGHYFSGSHYIMDTTSSTTGIIFKGTTRFLHNFHHATGDSAIPNGYNVFLGENAGNFTAGSTATNALHASYNVGIGYETLFSLTTGYSNIGIGYTSLRSFTTGRNCIGIGESAGRYIADGSTPNETSNTSIYLGISTKAQASGDANEIVIGYNAIGEGSNTAKYGNADITGHYFSGSHYIMDTTSSTTGIIFKGTTRFLHNFHHTSGSGGGIPIGRNVFLGEEAGNFTAGSTATSNGHASYNVGMGYRTLYNNTTGYNNNCQGYLSLYANTTGYNNAAFGPEALYANTTGRDHCAFGFRAGRYIADGSTANETSALSVYIGGLTKAQASGDSNEIVIGYNAIGEGSNTAKYGDANITGHYFSGSHYIMDTTSSTTGIIFKGTTRFLHNFHHTSGSGGGVPDGYNVFLGENAGNLTLGSSAVTAGHASYNVGIGYRSLFDATLAFNNTVVGSFGLENVTEGYSNAVLGTRGLFNITTGHSSVAVGTNSGRYIADGSTANQTSNASIYLGNETKAQANGDTNEIVIGYNAIGEGSNTAKYGNASITGHYFSGSHYIMDTTSSTTGIIFKGTTRFLHNFHHATGDSQIPLGKNTALGENAGNFTMGSTATNTLHGSYNTNIGNGAGQAITIGYSNNNFGFDAGKSITTGYNNVSFGSQASEVINTGYNNTNVGVSAGRGLTSGHSIVAIGLNSGRYIADGSTPNQTSNTSVYLGAATKAQASGDSNEIVIGYNAIGEGSNTAKYGNADITGHYFSGSHYIMDTTSSTTGIIFKGTTRFLHNFHHTSGSGGGVPTGRNIFLGENAGNFTLGSTATAASQASYNVGIGFQTLLANAKGYDNVAIGTNCLTVNTDGYNNLAIGGFSLTSNTTGYHNTAVGYQSLFANTTGYHNVAAGYRSGRYIADGSTANQTSYNSVYIGRETKAQASGDSNEIVIGYNAIGEGSNTAKYGDANITGHYFSGSHYIMDTTTSTTGIIFKGTTRFLHNFHHPTGDSQIPAGFNTFIGEQAGNFSMGSTATSTFHGSYNTGIGYQALSSLTIGYNNLGLGHQALLSATTAIKGVALGIQALSNITTGNDNTGIGFDAGRYIADDSTPNQTSQRSVYIGSDTKAKADGGNNEIVIGYDAIGEGSNTAKYGNGSITDHYFSGSVHMQNAFVNVTTVNAATYDLVTTDYILSVAYTSTAAVTSLTLPTAQAISGRTIVVKDSGGEANTNNITIDTQGSEKIDGLDTYVISANSGSVNIYCDGSNWFLY